MAVCWNGNEFVYIRVSSRSGCGGAAAGSAGGGLCVVGSGGGDALLALLQTITPDTLLFQIDTQVVK